jgi:hypothetical protein
MNGRPDEIGCRVVRVCLVSIERHTERRKVRTEFPDVKSSKVFGKRAILNGSRSGFERDGVVVRAIDKMMPEKTHDQDERPRESGVPFHMKVLSATIPQELLVNRRKGGYSRSLVKDDIIRFYATVQCKL